MSSTKGYIPVTFSVWLQYAQMFGKFWHVVAGGVLVKFVLFAGGGVGGLGSDGPEWRAVWTPSAPLRPCAHTPSSQGHIPRPSPVLLVGGVVVFVPRQFAGATRKVPVVVAVE